MIAVRALTGCLALLVAVSGAWRFAPDNPVLLASTSPVLVLDLRLTTTQVLPPASRAALMAETESIWNEAHIRLRWVDGEAVDDRALRVVVMARAVPAAGVSTPWAVGELVRMEGARALAIASITGARRIVEEAGLSRDDLPALHERRVGIVLGRAVAHEIGHYLLQTNTHASQGLMRARIDAREFADLRHGAFRLDVAAQAHIATLAMRGSFSGALSPTFSYSTH